MAIAIIGSVVKTLRERQKLSQMALAQKAGLSKDTLSRLERGKQSGGASRTREALAKHLNVAPEVLTGERPLPPGPETRPDSLLDDRQYQLNIRVDGAVRNAFSLVALRYGIPVARIVDLAPLLFTLAAEKSLQERGRRLDELEEALNQADAVGYKFSHLPATIAPGFLAIDSIAAERKSVSNADILAAQIVDENDLFQGYNTVDYEYDPDLGNPFVSSIREDAANHIKAEVTCFSRDDVGFRICGPEARKLAGEHPSLANAILNGWVLIHEIPRDLLAETETEARVAWLTAKAAEQDAAMLASLGLEL